jgi:hypothetical protein
MQHDTLHAPCGVQQSATWHAAGGTEEAPPLGHCVGTAPASRRVLQQRSAWLCDDATNSVAHPLQQRIACCNSAPYHNAATCCNAGQPAVAQPNLLQRSTTCCNAARSVETDHSLLQPVAAIATLCDPLQ